MSSDLIVQESHPVDVVEVAVLTKERLQHLAEQRKLFLQFVKEQLIRGIDYGSFGSSKKDVLLKPGAEKLCRLFGLGFRIKKEVDDIDKENRFILCSRTVEVYSLATGRVLAECQGSQNSLESQFRNQREPFAILNTLQKMAQKRAFVGAVLAATGASELFTQDLDDDSQNHPQRKSWEKIGPQDWKSFNAECSAHGWKAAEITELMQSKFGKSVGSDLLGYQLDELQNHVITNPKKNAG